MTEQKKLYLELYDQLAALQIKHNVCNIYCDSQGFHCGKNRFCCTDCDHLTESGCRIRSLYCKIWFCPECIVTTEYRSYITEAINVIAKIKEHNIPIPCREEIQ